MRLEQNNGIVPAVDNSTARKISVDDGLFYNRQLQQEYFLLILCFLTKVQHLCLKHYAENASPLLTSPPFIYCFSPHVIEPSEHDLMVNLHTVTGSETAKYFHRM